MRLIDRLERNEGSGGGKNEEPPEPSNGIAEDHEDVLFLDPDSGADDEVEDERVRSEPVPISGASDTEGNWYDDGFSPGAVPEPTPPPSARRTARNKGPRPLKEGLRKGLTEERVWLQVQREELEREREELIAEIEAEIGEVDGQIVHIDALLGSAPADSDGTSAGESPSSLPAALRRTG